MRVAISFPGYTYSENKVNIAKVRKSVGCKGWTGASWEWDEFIIETDFRKAAEKLGIQREYDGDILTLNGPEDFCEKFTDKCESWGATFEVLGGIIEKEIAPPDPTAAVENFCARAAAQGLSESFMIEWACQIMVHVEQGGIAVT